MAEIDSGLHADRSVAALAQDTPASASVVAANPSSYCGECGSWGAHGARCVSCGYDFYAEPIDSMLD